MRFTPLPAALALLLAAAVPAAAGDGLALTPPMGWNSWNKFACNVSEQLIKDAADAMVAAGMKDAGYQYVVIDDCWQVRRDESGTIVADPTRFPSGIKALADYVHAKGLKFGIYSDAGTMTCQKRPGSKDHELQDARTYASWGVDYLKYDWCSSEGQDARDAYQKMSQALRASGRQIVFSICEWGSSKPWTWAQGVGQLWRATGDIQDCWDCGRSWGGMGVTHIVDLMQDLWAFSGPGHWNDPDMLEVGNGGLNLAENRAHFSFWCLFAAPLMAGNDLKAMTTEVREILTNREAIAVDQDPLGMQGRKVRDDGPREVWLKPLADGSKAVILWNRGTEESTLSVEWQDVGLFPGTSAVVRDLWNKADVAAAKGRFEAKVGGHDVAFIRISPKF
ncbi:MAG: glycoside hydrolase family 27 protein [Betaproteobacteria bacterium]